MSGNPAGRQRCLLACVFLAACGESHPGAVPDGADPERDRADLQPSAGRSAAPTSGPGSMAELPSDLVATEIGGYKLGEPLVDESAAASFAAEKQSAQACTVMRSIVRDFKGEKEAAPHPDFEVFQGKNPTPGLVAAALGSDAKPIYSSKCEAPADRAACPYGQQTTSQDAFDQWYRSTADVNLAYVLYLGFAPNDGVYTFRSDSFFPLDDAGWGNAGSKRRHNFGFTTEVHASFLYSGGEQLSFTGDDDLWIFINGQLAIDLGGLHPPATATLDLDSAADSLGLTPGHTYALALFHAERHSAASNFRVDTTIAFTECGTIVPD